jgi:hypothetical protein
MTRKGSERTHGRPDALAMLLRRDTVLGQPRMLLKLVMVGLLLANILGLWAGVAVYRDRVLALQVSPRDSALLLGVIWLVLSSFLLALGANARCSQFDLTLPVPARTFWLIRVLVTLGAGLIVPCILPPVAVLVARLRAAPVEMTGALVQLTLYLISGTVLAVALIHAYRPGLSQIRLARPFLTYFVIANLVILAVLVVASALSPFLCVIPTAAGAILLWRTYRALPATLQLVPRESHAAPGQSAAASHGTHATAQAWAQVAASHRERPERRPAASASLGTILRTLYAVEPRMAWAFLLAPLIVVYGIMLSAHIDSIGIVQVTWLWMLMTLQLGLPLARLVQIDPLPLARRRMLPWIILPTLALAIVPYVATQAIGDIRRERRSLIACEMQALEDGTTRCQVRVPGVHFELAGHGVAPRLTSPWGESHAPWQVAIVRGRGMIAYNPYDTPAGASARFVALQLSRAIETAYGERISADELEQRYLETRADGSAGLRARGFTLLEDYPRLQARSRAQVVPFVILLIALPWLLLVAALLGPLAASTDAEVRRRVTLLLVVLPLVCTGAFIFAGMKDVLDVDFFNAAVLIMARHAAASVPGHDLTLWGIALVLIGAGYAVAAKQFAKLEVPLLRKAD